MCIRDRVSGGAAVKAPEDLSNIKIEAQPNQDDKREMDAGKLFGNEPPAASEPASGAQAEDPNEAIRRALEQDQQKK